MTFHGVECHEQRLGDFGIAHPGPSRATRNATARATDRGPKAVTWAAASSLGPISSARSCWISSGPRPPGRKASGRWAARPAGRPGRAGTAPTPDRLPRHPERKTALQLPAPPGEHSHTRLACTLPGRSQQHSLANPRRAGDQQYATATGPRRGQQRIHARQLTLTLTQSNQHHTNTPPASGDPANAVPLALLFTARSPVKICVTAAAAKNRPIAREPFPHRPSPRRPACPIRRSAPACSHKECRHRAPDLSGGRRYLGGLSHLRIGESRVVHVGSWAYVARASSLAA